MKKIIIITGGAGFVGSHLIEKILKKTNKKIEETHIYERGGRSYVQTPLHRFLFELRKLKN